MKINEIYLGDCLELMPKFVDDKSIDMIFCDLPYGTTACKWDTIIPFDKLWSEYERIIKDNGAIVLFASQPFTSNLIMSNTKLFKYDLTWIKERPSNPALAKKRPLNYKEDICVFYKKQPTYNPQMTLRDENNKRKNLAQKQVQNWVIVLKKQE
jgi:site-specific DNA-methyltransferase (adenine-specific)